MFKKEVKKLMSIADGCMELRKFYFGIILNFFFLLFLFNKLLLSSSQRWPLDRAQGIEIDA